MDLETDGFWPPERSRLLAKVFEGLDQFCEAYLGDVLVFGVTWSQHIDHLNQVFNRIKLANLKFNVAKCQFANTALDFLGHALSGGSKSSTPPYMRPLALCCLPDL